MKQTILVTGGTGFIGSHTTVELQEAGYKVVIVDNLSNSKKEVVDGIEKITGVRPAFEQVDCCDLKALEGVFEGQRFYDIMRYQMQEMGGEAIGQTITMPAYIEEKYGTTTKMVGKPWFLKLPSR
jgi:UDP-glucose 4-epimerase